MCLDEPNNTEENARDSSRPARTSGALPQRDEPEITDERTQELQDELSGFFDDFNAEVENEQPTDGYNDN